MIHLYKFKEINILLDVNSGAAHVVSDIVYDILLLLQSSNRNPLTSDEKPNAEINKWEADKQSIKDILAKKYETGELDTATSEIDTLISEGTLFAPDTPQSITSPETRGAVIKAMCLHVAHDCNMRCAYCFADTGGFSGERSLLPLETGKKAIDFLLEHSGSRHNLEVDFFGGEPLMNFDVVKELVHYGREKEKGKNKNIRFTITTNGLLLDKEKEAFINEHMDNVILSIDGRPEVNDKMRKTPSGKGTYEYIIENLKRFRDNREGLYYVRGTFTRNNLDFSSDVLFLADQGFEQLSIEPVVLSNDSPLSLTEEDLPAIFSEYEALAKEYLSRRQNGQRFNFFHFMVDLKNSPCLGKRVKGCGAGDEYIAVTPEGDIYPCHQFVGGSFKMGNVLTGEFNEALRTRFRTSNLSTKPACQSCWAKYFCSGGCAANAYNFNGDINSPYTLACEMQKKRLECALYVYATELLASESTDPLQSDQPQ